MRSPRGLLTTSIALLVGAVPSVAAATPSYPSDLQSDLMLAYTTPCSVCHMGTPMLGSATTPFAMAMKTNGLVPLDDTSVMTALAKMKTGMVDSDHNGTTDIAQLVEGCDPSTDTAIESGAMCAGGSGDLGPTTVYGCGAEIAAGPSGGGGGAGVLAGLATLLAFARTGGRRRRAG